MTDHTSSILGEDGFTLVELMVSLFIFGLIAAAGVSLLTFSIRSQASTSSKLDEVAQDRRLAALLASDLAQAVPRSSRDVAGRMVRPFEGGDGSADGLLMSYVRSGWSNPDSIARSGVQRVDLMLDKGRLERRAYLVSDGTARTNTSLLASDVEAVAVRYRGQIDWRSRWDPAPANLLPRAVELTVKRKDRPALLTAFFVGTSYP
jgi:general secretion pathway protein J